MLILTGCLDFVGLCVRARACGVPHGALKKKRSEIRGTDTK